MSNINYVNYPNIIIRVAGADKPNVCGQRQCQIFFQTTDRVLTLPLTTSPLSAHPTPRTHSPFG